MTFRSVDFQKDFEEGCLYWLKKFGHRKADSIATRDAPLMLYRLKHRIPNAVSRRFRVHPRAKMDIKKLDSDRYEAIQMLRREVESGESLIPRMTHQIMRQFNDDFLNDWGIHHFHLGLSKDLKGFYERGSILAYAYIDERYFDLIRVGEHGYGDTTPWNDLSILRDLRNARPDVMRLYELGGIQLTMKLTGSDHNSLRGSGITTLIELDDKVYMSPGGGLTLDGGSTNALLSHNSDRHRIGHMEKAWLSIMEGRPARLLIAKDMTYTILVDGGKFFYFRDTEEEFYEIPMHSNTYRAVEFKLCDFLIQNRSLMQ